MAGEKEKLETEAKKAESEAKSEAKKEEGAAKTAAENFVKSELGDSKSDDKPKAEAPKADPPKAASSAASGGGGGGGGDSAERSTKDIHTGYRFFVEIEGINVAGFSECNGLSVEMETLEYLEGGQNTFVHKLPTRIKYSNVTLKRGLDPYQDLYEWFKKSMNGKPAERKKVTIYMYGPDQKVTRVYHLERAWPVKWVGADLKTDSAAAAIETLEFAHEGISVKEKGT